MLVGHGASPSLVEADEGVLCDFLGATSVSEHHAHCLEHGAVGRVEDPLELVLVLFPHVVSPPSRLILTSLEAREEGDVHLPGTSPPQEGWAVPSDPEPAA